MSCPTCDHTMEATGPGTGIFHCPRCGTVRIQNGHHEDTICVPWLVGRCREYAHQAIGRITEQHEQIWRRTGVRESINLPDERGRT